MNRRILHVVETLTRMERKKRDSEIEQWVLHELRSRPVLGSKEICVQSNEGVVTLSGSVHGDANKLAVEQAARRVRGIAGVVNDIKVVPVAGISHVGIGLAANLIKSSSQPLSSGCVLAYDCARQIQAQTEPQSSPSTLG